MISKQKVAELLSLADIEINGKDPWDIKVKNEDLFSRVLAGGSLAFGESYMDGWWNAKKLDEFFYRILVADLDRKVYSLSALSHYIWGKIVNKGRKGMAFEIGEKHYDIGNDLFASMLDSRLTYTCAYWKDLERVPENLERAQEQKLDIVCRKIGLKRGDRVLDIGCGWGSFMKFAAEKYGAKVTGITVSKEQVELGKKLCQGLPVKFKLEDYRNHRGSYDHVVSLGMFEHVGHKNYRIFMKVVHNALKNDGLFLLHTIGGNRSVRGTDPWIAKYIFPNSMIPSIKQIGKSVEGLFVMEDWHNFGTDYDKTLMAWHKNFEENWDKIKSDYDERFYRMWRYYLLCCAGSFRARKNQLWQIVLSKKGVWGGYKSIR